MTEREQLEQAIQALESQRALLGNATVDAAVATLREKLVALENAEPVSLRSPADQQRKQVTVLFADVSGFVAMSERRDAEEVADTMNALWQRIDAAILLHGGKIDKHIGDAVMALWGVEETREDDPVRAIHAALDLQAELAAFRAAYGAEHHVPLTMRVGINTGPVLLGDVGTTREFSVIGDTVNLASRLEEAAPVGGVLISHNTYNQVRGIFDMIPQEPVTVKGKSEPLQTYIVQQARPRAFRMATRGVEGIETHMVGREAELLILQNIFRDVMDDAQTRLVVVAGEAGVGKSRLLYEFDNWVDLLPEEVHYLKGRATQEMQSVPYGIIRDMFAYCFDILESDSAAAVLEKFHTSMKDYLDSDRADLVGHLVGFDFSASTAVQNLLGSPSFGELAIAYLTHYLRRVARKPTVIFLEDIHWADDSSLDLLDHLVTAIPEARLLMICLARPQLFERRPGWGKGREACIRLELKPLSRRSTRALVDEILQKVDNIPPELRDLVVDGAEGNPFYVEELIKMLIEDNVILRGEERWRVELDRLAKVRVPPTLTGVLQARLDSLPRGERALLQRASVVGRLFWDAAVAELRANDTDRLDRDKLASQLDAIRGRELVFRRRRSAFEGTEEYIFKHAILRDVTYETVLIKLRRVYHAQAAAWLEANAGERTGEYLGLIAGHYERAGETTKAAEYLQRLGEQAYKTSSFRDAIHAFEHALALLPEDDTKVRATLLVKIGNTLVAMGDYPAAERNLKDGLASAQAAGDALTEVAARCGLGRAAWGQGDYTTATQWLEQGLALARVNGDRSGMAECLIRLGDCVLEHGEIEKGRRYSEEGLALYRELGAMQGVAFALVSLGVSAFFNGDYEVARQHLEESLAISREIGDRERIADCLNVLGETARMQGKFEQARLYYEESLAIGQEIVDRRRIAVCHNNLGHTYIGLGEDDAAWEHLREALKKSLEIGSIAIATETLVGVAELQAKTRGYLHAAELLGLALGHPACDGETIQYANPVIARLSKLLPADQLQAALERGKSLDFEQLVAEILAGAAE